MTLGQKLKILLKDNGMTQEDLAERLEVSRQAVGKWVNDKGIPEVGKIVQISSLFGVSTDYLLKEDCDKKDAAKEIGIAEEKGIAEKTGITGEEAIVDEKAVSNNGYYVSQEMLDGYLAYNRRNVKQMTGGVSLFLLANVFACFDQDSMILSFLYWAIEIAGIAMIIWHFLQTEQYREIKKERLVFDDKVFGEFKRQRESRRKKYAGMMIAGVVILLASSEIGELCMISFGRTVCNVLEWVVDTVWAALMIWAGMSMHVDSIVVQNTERTPKSSRRKRYRWVYAALPVTALAVLAGIITSAWSPYAPILILFCCLLVTTCKLLIESRERDD